MPPWSCDPKPNASKTIDLVDLRVWKTDDDVRQIQLNISSILGSDETIVDLNLLVSALDIYNTSPISETPPKFK